MIQSIFRFLVRFVLGIIARIEIEGYENLPIGKPFILAANHLGRVDSAVLYYAIQYPNIIMPVAEKYKNHPIYGRLTRSVGGFFIDRFNPDIGAVREVLRRMKQNGIFVIAPEGTRSKTCALQPAHSGVAFFAVKTGAPVIPVALVGTEDQAMLQNLKRLRRSRILVRAGKPITLRLNPALERDAALQQEADRVMCHIAALLPESYRGVYAHCAGDPDHA